MIAEVWGRRRLVDPRHAPVLEGRWDYGSLVWPGIEGEITQERALSFSSEYAYVRDDVLQPYEEYPDRYTVYPELGSVSYGGQWSISNCRRVCRNLIRVDIKRLYEGSGPDEVRHWHEHAVEPPVRSQESRDVPNVGVRSKRIVYALTKLGEVIAELASSVMGKDLDSNDFVKLSRNELDYSGWWHKDTVIPITRHIPVTMGKSDFLERCMELNSLIVEGLSERNLRNLVSKIGVDAAFPKDSGSLKLLDVLVQYGIISCESGLRIVSDSNEIQARLLEKRASNGTRHLETPIKVLFPLHDLRNVKGHPGTDSAKPLRTLGIDHGSVEAGYGAALDKLYDEIGAALERTVEVLEGSVW